MKRSKSGRSAISSRKHTGSSALTGRYVTVAKHGKNRSTADVVAAVAARAAADEGFAAVLGELAEIPTTPAGHTTSATAAAVNDARRRVLYDEFKAHAVTTDAARKLLGFARPQNLHTDRQRRRVLGQTLGNATYFPAWQFSGGAYRADLARIFELLGRNADDAVIADRIMRLAHDDLGGRSIADTIDDPVLGPTAWVILAEAGR